MAAAWLDELPAGRVFTAERVAYRNLLAGEEPDVAGHTANPFQDWIGAQIRTDVYGWVSPGNARRAAQLAWQDGRLTHHRSGLYGALFVAAASSAATAGAEIADCIEVGLSVIPPESRYAAAIRRGVELAGSAEPDEVAIDAIHRDYGHLHWVHAIDNSALLAFALARSAGDFTRAVTTVVSGGWDTDSNGATAGAICGAINGASALPHGFVGPLRNRLASSVRGFDGVTFDELADRTRRARLSLNPMTDDALLHPRPIDLPSDVPLEGPIDPDVADNAKIFAAPDDPSAWPRWRERLTEWRDAARRRWRYDDSAYTRPSAGWASRCFSVALVWLWDERLFDHDAQRFDVAGFLASTADVRRVRRDRALAGVPDHRHRRADPVRLLPRRPVGGRRGAGVPRTRHQGVRRLQPVGHDDRRRRRPSRARRGAGRGPRRRRTCSSTR